MQDNFEEKFKIFTQQESWYRRKCQSNPRRRGKRRRTEIYKENETQTSVAGSRKFDIRKFIQLGDAEE